MIEKALFILKNIFGYPDFRLMQKQIIENILDRKDTLVIMPTGSGKSICYQIPALLFEGLTIVVSPLISLMKDQVEQLEALDIKAAFLNSSLSHQDYQKTLYDIREQNIKMLYLAPETLLKPQIMELVQSIRVDCLTIDEAHCISEWGHDFRPEYRRLVNVRKLLSNTVCIALTATATPQVQEDIRNTLGFQTSNTFLSSFDRDNLMIEVVPKQDAQTQMLDFVKRFPGQPGIIYCITKKQVDNTARYLIEAGYNARPYHAGLTPDERKKNQDMFIKDDIQIVVATVAFGMGINKPNVRFVLHYDLPKNIEGYYQQIGRAGRDGLKSYCQLLFSYGDINKITFFIDQKAPEEQFVAREHLDALLRMLETEVCRRISLLHYFGETYPKENCGMCDNCLDEEDEEKTDLTIPAQKFLSCVKRTGEKFGTNHIINVLRGSNARKIIDFSHHNLSTYGIGKEFSSKEWQHISHQLLVKKMVNRNGDYNTLTLTQRAYRVFRGEEKVFGTLLKKEQASPASRTSKNGTSVTCERPDLFEILKSKRKELADELKIPPYAVFPDKTLIDMTSLLPLSQGELLQVHGIGQVKRQKFGTIFLDIISAYCKEKGIEREPQPDIPEPLPVEPVPNTPRKYHETARQFIEGESVESLAERNKVKIKTIIGHLQQFLKEGKSLPEENIKKQITIGTDKISKIESSFHQHGTEYLKPVYNALDGEFDYDTLSLFRLLYLSRVNSREEQAETV